MLLFCRFRPECHSGLLKANAKKTSSQAYVHCVVRVSSSHLPVLVLGVVLVWGVISLVHELSTAWVLMLVMWCNRCLYIVGNEHPLSLHLAILGQFVSALCYSYRGT